MRFYKRLSFALFVCLSLSIVYSVSVYADYTILENLKVDINSSYDYHKGDYVYEYGTFHELTIHPNNGTQEFFSEDTHSDYLSGANSGDRVYYFNASTMFKFTNEQGSRFIKGGRLVRFILEDAYYNIGYKVSDYSGGNTSSTYLVPNYNRVLVGFVDGTYEYLELDYELIGTNTILEFEYEAPKDINSIEFQLICRDVQITVPAKGRVYFWSHAGEYLSDDSFKLSYETEDESVGLLTGIIEWIKGIYNKVVNMVDYIQDLPRNLWNLMSDGLKSLFVPSETYIREFKDTLQIILSYRLGAVYEVIDLTLNSFEEVTASGTTEVITIPEVTIELPYDTDFTFGGYEVRVVPDGFSFLADIVKLMVGICSTILFVNGLHKRYEEVMGVEK